MSFLSTSGYDISSKDYLAGKKFLIRRGQESLANKYESALKKLNDKIKSGEITNDNISNDFTIKPEHRTLLNECIRLGYQVKTKIETEVAKFKESPELANKELNIIYSEANPITSEMRESGKEMSQLEAQKILQERAKAKEEYLSNITRDSEIEYVKKYYLGNKTVDEIKAQQEERRRQQHIEAHNNTGGDIYKKELNKGVSKRESQERIKTGNTPQNDRKQDALQSDPRNVFRSTRAPNKHLQEIENTEIKITGG